MSSFREFMDEIEETPAQLLPCSGLTVPGIQLALTTATAKLLTPFSFSDTEKEKFSEEVSGIIQDKSFLSELSDKINEPLEDESEDDFVKRSSNTLRQMLYKKFNIKS